MAKKKRQSHAADIEKVRGHVGRPRTLTDETRRRLFLKHFDEGYSATDIWRRNRDVMSARTVQRLVQEFHANLDWRTARYPVRQRNAASRDLVLQVLKRVVDANPAMYLDEIQRELRKEKITVHVSTICRYLHAPAPRGLGYTLLVLERRALEKSYTERKRFLDLMKTGMYPVKQMIFVDECHKSKYSRDCPSPTFLCCSPFQGMQPECESTV